MAHYQELLDGELLAPASTLVGGVRAKRGVDSGTVQPLIGVYLLMLKGKVACTCRTVLLSIAPTAGHSIRFLLRNFAPQIDDA